MGILDALRDPQFRQDVKNNARNFGQSASNTLAGNVAAPLDLIALALRKAGIPVPEPVGGSQWMANQGLTREVTQGAPKLAGEAFGLIAPLAGAPQSAAAIARGLRQMGDNVAAPRTMNPQTGAIVWHGSPHKFDKFDASKIGTGEGAQAYGHGLYFAESPDVAQQYARSLTDPSGGAVKYSTTGLIPTSRSGNVQDAIDGNMRLIEVLKKRAAQGDAYAAKQIPSIEKKIAEIADKAQMYKVDLPDDQIAKMLDWDKPLSQQAAGDAIKPILDPLARAYGYGPLADPAGRQLQRLFRETNPAQFAEKLREKGIPGIRYLDGGSRGAGQGSSNFVVFPGNENMLQILERNGQPLGLLK